MRCLHCTINIQNNAPKPAGIGSPRQSAGYSARPFDALENAMRIIHTIPPVFDENSRLLILGSFPSVKSREAQFFYGHPQNRFWRVLAAIFDEPVPGSHDEKRKLLLSHGVALWDVVAECDIEGSADNKISNAVPNDLSPIFARCDIRRVFVNGRTAQALYDRLLRPATGRDAIYLPSTSPANAAYSLERLTREWRMITK